jgi:hypothetical protein
MAEITYFAAMAFDFIDGDLVAGEPIDCPGPAVAIQTAQGQWKVFGHAGAIAFSRTSDFEKGKFNHKHVLRRFGQVPDEVALGQAARALDLVCSLIIEPGQRRARICRMARER